MKHNVINKRFNKLKTIVFDCKCNDVFIIFLNFDTIYVKKNENIREVFVLSFYSLIVFKYKVPFSLSFNCIKIDHYLAY